MAQDIRVWFVAPEMAPFAKTGGLADVAESLPYAVSKLGVEVAVGLPFYRTIKEQGVTAKKVFAGLKVPLGDAVLPCDVFEVRTEQGVPVFLFDRNDLFDRMNLYGTWQGDYEDNLERFSYLSRAALIFAKEVRADFNVVHCHDWQTGLVPAYLKTLYRKDPFLSKLSSVFTIHNMGYQGIFPAKMLSTCGLPASELHPDGIEYWGDISLLKAGIVYADAITTVSPRYSREIKTPEFGLGMEGILRNRSADLHGILNGANYAVWNPVTDPLIDNQYSADDMKGKRICKATLIREMGLDAHFLKRPLCGVISRLTAQKGYELFVKVVEDIIKLDVGLVILAAGEQKYQQVVGEIAQQYPARVFPRFEFDETLAHRIMAGADMLLVPSRYEPCGLTQIHALKYGTVPIVRATGGLDDTIEQFDPRSGKGTGFKFAGYKAKDFLGQIETAVRMYDNRVAWGKVVENGMRADFSWKQSAQEYVSLYKELVRRKQGQLCGLEGV